MPATRRTRAVTLAILRDPQLWVPLLALVVSYRRVLWWAESFATPPATPTSRGTAEAGHLRDLHIIGTWSGLTAGVWLGAAEAPPSSWSPGLSRVLISFCMVLGVFVGRWSLPALVHGARYIRADVRMRRT